VGSQQPRVDTSGWPACEDCGKRLSKCKGKLYVQSPGKICNNCYFKKHHSPPSASSAFPIPPPKRRRVVSDPGEHSITSQLAGNKRIAAPLQSSSSPPSPYSFSSHGWSRCDTSRAGKALASAWRLIVPEVQEWIEIRGGIHQTDTTINLECAQINGIRMSARSQMESMMRAAMRKDGTEESTLYLSEMQLAVSPPGKGLQKPHYDVAEYEVARQSHVVIFYCTDTMSTAVPVHSLEKMRSTFTDGEGKLSSDANSLATDKDSYISFPVEAGSALHMVCNALHHGIENMLPKDRIVIFGLFVPWHLRKVDATTMRYPGGAPRCPNTHS
jgi:hypothetical protein